MKVNVPHRTQYIVVFLNGKHKMLWIRMLHKNEYLLVSGFSRRTKNTNIFKSGTWDGKFYTNPNLEYHYLNVKAHFS